MTREFSARPRPRSCPRARSLAASPAAGLLLLASALASCAPANTAPPPSVATPSDANPRAHLSSGAEILVSRGALWLPARLVAQIGPERYVVQYDGYGPEWNEPVTADRIKARPPRALARDYRVGERVLVAAASNKIFSAEIVQQLTLDRWRVHYDGYGPEVAEDVGPERLRRPYTGASALAVGQPVAVRSGDLVLLARVVAVVEEARWLVRFDGFGPESDQEVGPERIVPQASVAGAPASPPQAMPPDRWIDPDASSPTAPAATNRVVVPAPGDSPPGAPELPAVLPAALALGDEVFVTHRGVVHRAVVIAVAPDGTYSVRYDTPSASGQESVAPDRVRRAPPPLGPGSAALQPNQKILVEWHGMFFPARVVREAEKGKYRVRFEGLGPEADEIVPARRIRPGP